MRGRGVDEGVDRAGPEDDLHPAAPPVAEEGRGTDVRARRARHLGAAEAPWTVSPGFRRRPEGRRAVANAWRMLREDRRALHRRLETGDHAAGRGAKGGARAGQLALP